MIRLWLALLLGGCSNDPCAGKPAVCISVRATGPFGDIDSIALEVSRPGVTPLHAEAKPTSGRFRLPILFAVRLPADFKDRVTISGRPLVGGTIVGTGSTSVTVGSSGHASTTLPLVAAMAGDFGPPAEDLAGDLAGDAALTDLAAAAADLAPAADLSTADPYFTSGEFPSTVTGTVADKLVQFVNPSGNTIMITTTAAFTAGISFSFMANGCTTGLALTSGASCSMTIRFSPTAQIDYNDVLTVSHSLGTTPGALHGRGVIWEDESIVAGPGSLTGISGTNATDVWACGGNNLLYRRTTSWTQQGGYTSGSPSFNGIYVTDQFVYLIDHSDNLYRYDRTVASWDSKKFTGSSFTGITGEGEKLWLVSNNGGVLVGSYSGFIAQDRVADGTPFAAIAIAGTSAYAVGNDKYARRNPIGWQAIIADNGLNYDGVWASTTDIFAVGTRMVAGMPKMTVVHSLADNSMRNFTDIINGAAHGVWGESANDVFIAGEQGYVARSTETAGNGVWKVEPIGTTVPLHAVWGSAGQVWVVGDNLTIAHRY